MISSATVTGNPAARHAPPAPWPGFSPVKGKQQAAWASGDYGVIGITLQVVGETLCEAVNVRGGERVLDVAAGNGNASLAAARRYATVVSTDYVDVLLDQAATRAAAERLPITFRLADAENLPFEDGTFDVVLSTFGVMFVPDPERAAAELLRVCRPGGRIGLASWTPDSMVGRLFRVLGRFLPPAPGLKSPSLWGTEDRILALFGDAARTIETVERSFAFRYRSAEHWLEIFRTYYGPVQKAFAALSPADQDDLEAAILALLRETNRDDETLVVPAPYLEAVITKA